MTKSKAQKARARARRGALGGKLRRPPPRQKLKGRNATAMVPYKAQPQRPPKRKNNRGGTLGNIPRMMNTTDGLNTSVVMQNNSRIEDRFAVRFEKIADVAGSTTAFAIIKQLYINPGNVVLHPVFAQTAATYEQYRINVMKFHYVTRSYTASGSNVAAGRLIMATNFDVDDSAFTTTDQMENYEKSIAFEPYSKHVIHDVLQARRSRSGGQDLPLKNYFVYPSANAETPVTGNGKFYDVGNFQFAASGTVDSTSLIGELWVEYSYTMIRPKQNTPLGNNLLAAHIVESPVTTSAVAGSAFLGTTGGVLRAGSNIPSVVGKSTFTLPVAGEFLLSSGYYGSVTVACTYTFGSNIVGYNLLDDSAQSQLSAVQGGNTYNLCVVNVNAAGTGAANTVTITGLTGLAAGSADIFISQLPSSLTLTKRLKSNNLDNKDYMKEIVARLEELEFDHQNGKWKDVGMDSDYCNSRRPPIPSRSLQIDDDAKSVASRRSQPK